MGRAYVLGRWQVCGRRGNWLASLLALLPALASSQLVTIYCLSAVFWASRLQLWATISRPNLTRLLLPSLAGLAFGPVAHQAFFSFDLACP